MKNVTKGWTWSKTVSYASSLASVEWIAEAALFKAGVSTLMYFNSASFGGLVANGKNPRLQLADGVVLGDPDGGNATPCDPNGGNAFIVVYYGASSCPGANAKLVGDKVVGPESSSQGHSVALSADGNTAISGGPSDNSYNGAAWVFTRTGATWNQQGNKLVGTQVQNAVFGWSIALSGDGNTALVGEPDSVDGINVTGDAWVFVRAKGIWTRQSRLIGTGSFDAEEGGSVALSYAGSTAILGGYDDWNGAGAAWVFGRTGGAWSQQGDKLVGTGALGTTPYQGYSVALSGDGQTAISGGVGDNCYIGCIGAAWVFARSGNTWTQAAKLVGSNVAGGSAGQGWSVALSGDGDTAIVGGPQDNGGAGAAWIFTKFGGIWTQQGDKLVGTGAVGAAGQGNAVALSADGNTAIVAGNADDSGVGAAWVFVRSNNRWSQQGSKLVGAGAAGKAAQGYSVGLSATANTVLLGGLGDDRKKYVSVGAAFALVPRVAAP